jgi:hypothetical protein
MVKKLNGREHGELSTASITVPEEGPVHFIDVMRGTEYLAAENRILKAELKARLKLLDVERAMLGEIGHRPGRKAPGLARVRPSWAGRCNRSTLPAPCSRTRIGPSRWSTTPDVEKAYTRPRLCQVIASCSKWH